MELPVNCTMVATGHKGRYIGYALSPDLGGIMIPSMYSRQCFFTDLFMPADIRSANSPIISFSSDIGTVEVIQLSNRY